MNDDHWLRELAEVNEEMEAEERDRLDDRWDRLSHGELSPEEEAELRALAETFEEAREAWEAFRPLGADFQARVVESIQSEIAAAKPPAKLLKFRRRIAGWSAAAAAAAAMLILSLWPLAPLPDYAHVDVSGGVSAMRGEHLTAKIPVLAPGDRFQAILRPETTASRSGRLEAQIFLSRGPELRHLEAQPEIDPGGSVKVEGRIDRDVQAGTWILWTVVGRQGKLPDADELRRLSATARIQQKDWIAVPREIQIQPRHLPP